MIVLAFDTAGPNCAVAIARQGGDGVSILARSEERIGTGHAERLMPMIEAALAEAGISYGGLSRIAVATGPGSFTGVRIGVAAARGLALALGIPAVGIGVLETIAFAARRDLGAAHPGAAIAACLDARRGEIYALVEEAEVSAAPLPFRTDVAALAARLAASVAPAVVLAGSAAEAVAGEPALAGRTVALADTADCADVAVVAALGLAAPAGERPSPLYLRPPDAKPQAGKAVARL